MIFGEESPLGVLQIEHADNVPLIDERHNQFGARFGIELDVSRIFSDVRYEQRLFMLGGETHKSFAVGDLLLNLNLLVEAQREAVLEFGACGIEQQDAEHLVIDDSGELFAYAFEQFVEVKDRRQVAADFVEQNQGAR